MIYRNTNKIVTKQAKVKSVQSLTTETEKDFNIQIGKYEVRLPIFYRNQFHKDKIITISIDSKGQLCRVGDISINTTPTDNKI